MNNKAQSLVLFVCLLPIFIAIFAYIFDTSYIIINESKLNNINEIAIKYAVEKKDLNNIKEIIYQNDKDIKIIKLTNNNIKIKKELEPIFGQIIGFKKYNIKSNLYGYEKNNKIIIQEKG